MAHFIGYGLHLKDGLIHIFQNCLADLTDKDFDEELRHVRGYECHRVLFTGPVKNLPAERLRLIINELDRFSGDVWIQNMTVNQMIQVIESFDRIDRLTLNKCLYGRPTWVPLFQVIETRRVRSLNISWKRDGKTMESYFQLASPWLQEISLTGSAYDLNHLGGWIKRLPNLKKLKLKGGRIFADSVDPFFDTLCHHPSIEAVEIDPRLCVYQILPHMNGVMYIPISQLADLDDAVKKWVYVRRRVVLLASTDLLPEDILRHVCRFII